jgi:hypothetical protein
MAYQTIASGNNNPMNTISEKKRQEGKCMTENNIQRPPDPSSKPSPRNVSFWFVQNVDRTMADGKTMTKLWAEAKVIWVEMCKEFRPLALLWSKVPAKQRLEFWLNLEC